MLDGNIPLPPPASALEEWYRDRNDVKIAELDVEDLARACRQNLYDEEIVPCCLLKLEQEPLAGDMYEGELVKALAGVSANYWRTHPREREQFLTLDTMKCLHRTQM
jgi:hypothetical protein